MADNFQGVADIVLQPGSATVPYTFTFAAASSATANDGSIPYDTTISGADVKAFDEAGVDKTTSMIASESNTTTVQTVSLKYPAITGSATSDPPDDTTGLLTDTGAAYAIDEWIGYWLEMTSGTASGKRYRINDSSATTLTCTDDNLYSDGVRSGDTYKIVPLSGSRYSLEILLTLNSGAVMEFDFTRIYAEDTAA